MLEGRGIQRAGLLLALSIALASCGLVTVTTSYSTSTGGDDDGGKKGSKGEFQKHDAAALMESSDACAKVCFVGVPECVDDCVAMRKEYTTTGKDSGKLCAFQNVFSEDNWKACYDGKGGCMERCGSCAFPKQFVEDEDVENQYLCVCPPQTDTDEGHPGECMAVLTIAVREKACKLYCRQDQDKCEHQALAELGYPSTDEKKEKTKQMCAPPAVDCYGDCEDLSADRQKLIDASIAGNAKKVRALLKKPPVGAFDSDDNFTTPIHHAAMNGNLAVVKIFVEEEGAIWTTPDFHGISGAWLPKDASGKTPLDYAVENGHEDVASYLRSKLGL